MDEMARIEFDGKTHDFPIVTGTEKANARSTSQAARPDRARSRSTPATATPARARARSRSSTASRASCATAATRSRSWPRRATFLEVAWLLIHGELPTRSELDDVHAGDHAATRCCTRTSGASSTRCRRTRTRCPCAPPWSARWRPSTRSPRPTTRAGGPSIRRLIAKMPTIAAYSYKHSIGQPFMYPRNDLDYSSNFLHMMFATPCEEYEVDPVRRAGARPAADPARRPRAELLDQHRAHGRQLAAPTCSRRSRPASARCGARCTAARTRR